MSHKFLLDTSFHKYLVALDQDLASKAYDSGCPFCGGCLHVNDYPRQPHGVPAEHRHYYQKRFSFCCGKCRRRVTPESVRFFGRRWYVAPFLLLTSILASRPSQKKLHQIKKTLWYFNNPIHL